MLKATAQTSPSVRAGWIGVGSGLLIPAVLMVLRARDPSGAVSLERPPLNAIAVFAVLAAPAGLAILGLRRRPNLLLVAACLSTLIALPFYYFALPMLAATPLYAIAYARQVARTPPRWTELGVAAAAGALALAAAFTFFFIRSPTVCWSEATYEDGTVRRAAKVQVDPSRGTETFRSRDHVVSNRSGCSESPLLPARSIAILSLTGASLAIGSLAQRKIVP